MKNFFPKTKLLKGGLFSAFVAVFLWFIFLVFGALTEANLPCENRPIELYANQLNDDLKQLFLSAIREAKQSIVLFIYSLSDREIIALLRRKSEEGLVVQVICDSKASSAVNKSLGKQVRVYKRHGLGLMHQKILVIDKQKVWLGSANMTGASLHAYGNLVIGLYHPEIAKTIIERADRIVEEKEDLGLDDHIFTTSPQQAGLQQIELWFTPNSPGALKRVEQLINSAKKTIRIAMFTWTHYGLARKVIDAAKKRGVEVDIVMDSRSAKGASAKIAQLLAKYQVPISLSSGNGLLHHKFLYIDGSILVNGSANWTNAAFTKNDDCFIVLSTLTEEQKKYMDQLWQVIKTESLPFSLQERIAG